MSITDCLAVNSKIIFLPRLQEDVLSQPHLSDMDIEKTRLLTRQSVFWTGMIADIAKLIKEYHMCLEFQQTRPKTLKYCMSYLEDQENKLCLCYRHHYSKFPVIKQVDDLSAESLILCCNFYFLNMDYQRKLYPMLVQI